DAFAPKTDQISVPSYPSVPAPNAPANPTAPGAAPAGNPLKSGSTGVIKMTVPEDSIVYINGYRTKMKGTQRSFNANNLEEGQSYSFEVRVVAALDGQLVEEVKETTLVGGVVSSLAFMQNSAKVSTVALK
ncbi:MAG: TIGR03000 domain-containing protein, partial [Thermoguttaceae bacterium]|nr:TIGR03000 domain-containing protein [Thermoguttaceae bacterium]